MPEDQGVNGDLWNDEAAVLLMELGWKQAADANIDVVTEDDKKRGLDRIFTIEDSRRNSRLLFTVFVEAKCYNTKSLSLKLLQDWVETLNKKLSKIKNSENFASTYPTLKDSIVKNGLIVIWFSDVAEYVEFKPTLLDYLKRVKIPGTSRRAVANHIYILHNEDILRLASLIGARNAFNQKHKTSLQFYYPSSDNFDNAIDRNTNLTLDYIFSKFVLAEANIDGVEHRVVFYFGALTHGAFMRLKSVLTSNSFYDTDKPLTIFKYKRDLEFRKVKPLVEELFSDVRFQISEMDIHNDLPAFFKLD